MENEVLTIFGTKLGWPEAFAIASAAFAIVLGISTYFVRHFAVEKDAAELLKVGEKEAEMTSMKKDFEIINREIKDLRKDIETHDSRDQADFGRLEEKIDNLNSLFIDFLQAQIKKE